jgi:hypothetical protein
LSIVNDALVKPFWEPVLMRCKEEWDTWPAQPRLPCSIKWSSKRDTLTDCKRIVASMPSTPARVRFKQSISHALGILEPFHEMTQLLQSDEATLFDAMHARERLTNDFAPSDATVPGMTNVYEDVTQALMKCFDRMCAASLYAIAAFFHPCFDRTSANAYVCKQIAKAFTL